MRIFGEGDIAPGLAPLQLGTLDDPVFNTNGDVAAVATLTGAGLTTANKKAIVLKPASDTAVIVARLGDQPADVAVGAKWKAFTSVALPDGLGPVFLATMVQGVGGVVTNNDRGMWAHNSAGVLQLLAREGDVIEGKILKTITVLHSVSGSSDQTRAFNANQQIIYHAAFTNGISAVVRVDVP